MTQTVVVLVVSFVVVAAAPAFAQKAAKTDVAEIYATNCQACHGPDGESPLAPLSFTDPEWKHGSRLQDIVKVITDGVEQTPMLPFKEKLSKEEIAALAKLVRSFDKSLQTKKPAKKDGPGAGSR
jgi:mono/diheme cytochrome c family protein